MMSFLKKHREEKCGRRDRKATESALLLAAGKLFAQKGYENTRTLDIAKEAGANEALILRYFGGKEGLLAAVIKDDQALQLLIGTGPIACSDQEAFPVPAKDRRQKMKATILQFFENSRAIVEVKEPYMRITTARALVDEEMAMVMRQKLIERQSGILKEQVQAYFKSQGKSIKPKELEGLVTLLSSTNYVFNFMGRKVYKVDDARLDNALEFLAEVLDRYFE